MDSMDGVDVTAGAELKMSTPSTRPTEFTESTSPSTSPPICHLSFLRLTAYHRPDF